MPLPRIAVIYHDHCADGFTAAWVAKTRFGEEATLIPYSQGNPLPPIPPIQPGGQVYLLDLALTPDYVTELQRTFGEKNVFVLDHHKSSMEKFSNTLPPSSRVVFDMNHSGAMLAWTALFPEIPPPNLVRYVEDRDLWAWALPYSKEVNTALSSYPLELAAWDTLNERLGSEPLDKNHAMVMTGRALLRYKDNLVATAIERTGVLGQFPTGETALFVNSSILASDIGNAEYNTKTPIVAVWTQQKDGRYYYSLRGGPDSPDLSKLAAHYGGGGHAKAAGFTAPTMVHTPIKDLDRHNSPER